MKRASTRIEYTKMTAKVQGILDKLEMSYAKNQGEDVTEFEVKSPCHFRVVVSKHTEESFGFPFKNRGGVETALELHRDLEALETDSVLRKQASSFVKGLVSSLPAAPWKGFGAFRTRSERNRWADLEAFPGSQD